MDLRLSADSALACIGARLWTLVSALLVARLVSSREVEGQELLEPSALTSNWQLFG